MYIVFVVVVVVFVRCTSLVCCVGGFIFLFLHVSRFIDGTTTTWMGWKLFFFGGSRLKCVEGGGGG